MKTEKKTSENRKKKREKTNDKTKTDALCSFNKARLMHRQLLRIITMRNVQTIQALRNGITIISPILQGSTTFANYCR